MKAVMLSIRPQWVEKIVNGEKTIEVRKSRPKIDTPFKCYIYMTQGKFQDLGTYSDWIYKRRMSVIGEFTCDGIVNNFKYLVTPKGLECACLTENELNEYLGYNGGYGWHISDLKVYDKPKELGEFKRWNRTEENAPCAHTKWFYGDCASCKECNLTRPPQSWQFIEIGE